VENQSAEPSNKLKKYPPPLAPHVIFRAERSKGAQAAVIAGGTEYSVCS